MNDGAEILASLSPFIQTLVGGLLALSGAWFSARSQRRGLRMQLQHEVAKARRDLKRERLEELYQHAYRYMRTVRDFGDCWLGVLQSQISHDQALVKTKSTAGSIEHDYERMRMLVDVYCPSVRQVFAELEDKRSTLVKHLENAHNMSASFGSKTAKYPKEMVGGLQEAIAACTQVGNKWKESIMMEIRAQV